MGAGYGPRHSGLTPRATYRIQLHADFGFDDAARLVPYLAQLGISHVYCSPILQAVAGSTHGYDVVDHTALRDELGGASGFARLSRAAAAHDIGLVIDIVPNHMALAGAANRWWWDVLEDGPASRFADYFDIDWSAGPGEQAPSVLMPVLGDHYGRILERGELQVAREGGAFVVRYHDHEVPLSPRSLHDIVRAAGARAKSPVLEELADRLEALPLATATDAALVEARHIGKLEARQDLRAVASAEPDVADALDAEIAVINADADALDALLGRQNYRLAHWRVASDELDYRRFFDITSLVGLRVEDWRVFADTHALVLDLVTAGEVAGLRIDHVDGLRDPGQYLERLRSAAPETWIVVEKIMAPGETLPDTWPVAGTTGYDFTRVAGNLFVQPDGAQTIVGRYGEWAGDRRAFADVAHDARLDVMRNELAAEVERVTDLLAVVCARRRRHRDHTRRDLRTVVMGVAAAMPVYRTYAAAGFATSPVDRQRIAGAVEELRSGETPIDGELLDLVERALCLDEPGEDTEEFAARFQQLSAPVTAKGVEDTAFYRWVPLLGANEVGGDPGDTARSAAALADFHAHNAAIAAQWPATMLALSTHDTKRSADVRARLAVLTEIAGAWTDAVSEWRHHNARHRGAWDDPVIELVLYQSLVGAWPIEAERLEAAMFKSAKEAKVRTSWRASDEEYERGLCDFVLAVCTDTAFLDVVRQFLDANDIVRRGHIGSLALMTLQLTAPGVPDVYQGDELWNHALVDPDNRRPVDHATRAALLDALVDMAPDQVLARSDEGVPKLWLLHRILQHRRRDPDCYRDGAYEPFHARGPRASDVVAFTRAGRLLVVAPCRTDTGASSWEGTELVLPPGSWADVVAPGAPRAGSVPLNDLLALFPVAVLERQDR
jgi:(1->4)-alpha-D-glucan 1-alpha-D-glucosylmutase